MGHTMAGSRLGPGLHGRAIGRGGHAIAGTAGALAALGQDASAPGVDWEVGNVGVNSQTCSVRWVSAQQCHKMP